MALGLLSDSVTSKDRKWCLVVSGNPAREARGVLPTEDRARARACCHPIFPLGPDEPRAQLHPSSRIFHPSKSPIPGDNQGDTAALPMAFPSLFPLSPGRVAFLHAPEPHRFAAWVGIAVGSGAPSFVLPLASEV